MNSESLARHVADLVLESKGLDVLVLDLRGRTSYTDFVVLASGTSDRHVQSVATNVADTLRHTDNIEPLGKEGLREGQWALIDLGEVILHVFHQYTREVYDLENLWDEAPRLTLEAPSLVGANA